MARDTVSAAEAEYIWDTILEATILNKMGRFKNVIGVHATDRRKLIHYIKKRRLKLHTITFKDDQGEFTFDENDPEDMEIMEMLYAIEPFIIYCQNSYGPDTFMYEEEDHMDITKISQDAFFQYFYEKFDINNPTVTDSDMRREQWERRHPASPLNGASAAAGTTSTTPTSSSTPRRKRGMMKPSTINYPMLKDDAGYYDWINKVKAISKSEGTDKVFDPNYVPVTPQEVEDFEQDKTHIIAVLFTCGGTSIIKGILQKYPDGQVVVQKMMEQYSGNSAGRIRAQEIKNELEQKLPANHGGQAAECLRVLDSKINELNSIVEPSLQYDSSKRYDLIKDFLSEAPGFDSVEDSINSMNLINVSRGGTTLSNSEKCDLYKAKAVSIDTKVNKDKTKKKSSVSSAVRSALSVNATEILLGDNDMIENEEEQAIDIQALAAKSFRKGMDYNNRSPNPSLMLPEHTFKKLTKEGKRSWIGMPDNDRATIVSAIGSAVASTPDRSKHPSPGNSGRFSTNNHQVSFDDQNPYAVLEETTNEVSNEAPGISMNNLKINHVQHTPSNVKIDHSDEEERALSIMSAVTTGPFKSDDFNRAASTLPPHSILRALSTSASVTSPLSGTTQEPQWKYGENGDSATKGGKAKTKNFIQKIVQRKNMNAGGNIQINMARVSSNNANTLNTTGGNRVACMDRGAYMDLIKEDKSTIAATTNDLCLGQLGWETSRGLSGRGLMFLGTSKPYGEQTDYGGEGSQVSSGTFAGVIVLKNGERVLGIFNEYSNVHVMSDPVHSMEQLTNSGATISNGHPSSGDEPQVKLKDGEIIPLVEIEGKLHLMCDQPTLSDLIGLRKIEITRAHDGNGIKDGDSVPELEDPDADDREVAHPPNGNKESPERARYIAIATDPITRVTKVGIDWTIKKNVHGSIAKARIVSSPGKIKINELIHSDLPQGMVDATDHGEEPTSQDTDLSGAYIYRNRGEDDMYYNMESANNDTSVRESM